MTSSGLRRRPRGRRAVLLGLALAWALVLPAAASEEIQRRVERGPVAVDLALRPAEPVIGDVLELELSVRAEAGVEVLMPEFGEALGRFEIVDFAPRSRQDELGRTIHEQRYRLHPPHSGPQSIPPLRVEFVDRREGQRPAPEGEDAFEILTERIALEVAPILAEGDPLELRPRHDDLPPRREPAGPWWLWALGLASVAALFAPFARRGWLALRARQREQSAYERARSALDALLTEGRPSPETMDGFYVSLSRIVRRYLEDRFALRSPELTTQEFLAEMGRSPDLARSHQRLLRDFLEQADLVKFAGHRPTDQGVSESIAAAERFLEETRTIVRAGEPGGMADREDGRAERA